MCHTNIVVVSQPVRGHYYVAQTVHMMHFSCVLRSAVFVSRRCVQNPWRFYDTLYLHIHALQTKAVIQKKQ